MSRISSTFENLRKRGEKALITFLTAGDPSIDVSEQIVHALVNAGVDLIELGVPFSDPSADGPTIQKASERALAAGASLTGTLEMVSGVRQHTNVPIVLMGYYNPILQYDPERFARDAAEAGVDGILLVDLPPEESEELHPFLKKAGIDLITLLTPTTDPERTAKLSAQGEGFLYYVSMTGVTGSKKVDSKAIEDSVRRLKHQSTVPVAVGFGISTVEEARSIAHFSDAVVVGSALVKLIAEYQHSPVLLDEVAAFASRLKSAVKLGGQNSDFSLHKSENAM